MADFSLDSDLLVFEPNIFALRFDGQLLAGGDDGATDATGLVFSSAGADFESAGVTAGHAVGLTIDGVVRYWSVLDRASAQSLNLASLADAGLADLAWSVHTFGPQHLQIRDEILARKGVKVGDESETRSVEQVVNTSAVRRVSVLGVLALIYRAQANNIETNSDWWLKAEYYEARYRSELEQLEIEWDIDESGTADCSSGGGRSLLGRS